MKKRIVPILIIVILINFIIPKLTYATSENSYNAWSNEGKADVNGTKQSLSDMPNSGPVIATILATSAQIFGTIVEATLSSAANLGNPSNSNNTATETTPDGETQKKNSSFTIASLVSGEYELFNIDFFGNESGNSTNNMIKQTVAEWYYGIRNLSIIISLFVLIYIGIRMAISTVALEKAKYKKMLIGWIQSFVLIFFLHYIMIAATFGLNQLMKMLPRVDGKAEGFLLVSTMLGVATTSWNTLIVTIIFWMLVYYHFKFFMLYAKRLISIAFLIVIAPLITDHKAQAFNTWLKEFLTNIFIQPLHVLLYLIFFWSASEIALRVPMFTIVFLAGLSRAEKVIKGIFEVRGLKSINSVGKGRKKK